MPTHGLLVLPSANRVYADASVELTVAELGIFNQCVLGGRLTDIGPERIGGVPYLTFTCADLSDHDVALLSAVSTAYALFAFEGPLLRPVPLSPPDRFDDDLLTVLKYVGKTNETFTRLLLNATVLASSSAAEMLSRRLKVLDPLCGRGTTLNQAAMYGYDAAGIDLDGKDFDAYAAFLGTWLKRKRLKHRLEVHPVRREKKLVARRLEASFAASSDEFKAGEGQHLTVVNADTVDAERFFKGGSFDAVVTDAPYGVQHGSRTSDGGLARRPLDLLAAAVPGWARLLRPGGALGISWNTHVAGRDALEQILVQAGLTPVHEEPFLHLRHRVDQAIMRDVVIARRLAPG